MKKLALHLVCSTPAEADVEDRTITGLAVPYGPTGHSSMGPITFAQGSLVWAEQIGRVKLLVQHDSKQSIGYATKLEDTPAGLQATFHVPESPEGDKALAEAADGRRDGLSVGVMLDAAVEEEIWNKLWEGDETPTAASGQLVEISQVSMPAFDDARTDGSAALAAARGNVRGLEVLEVTFATQTPATVAGTEKGTTMPQKLAASAAAPAAAASATTTEPPAQAATETTPPPPAPAPTAYAGGAAIVSAEAPVYTFDGRGPSFVRDIYHARFSGDIAAMARLDSFNKRMIAGDETQVVATASAMLTAAVETRTTEPNLIQQGYRPDLLVAVVDQGRPLVSRIGTISLTDATPFRVPVEGEFDGVADHVEGTAHVAEGDMALGSVTVTPGAISGAYRLSRELIDSSNPAIDQIALRAMLRDYRRATEAKVVAALVAAAGAAVLNIDKVLELSGVVNDFYDLNLEAPSFIAAASSYYKTLRADVDTTGRPMLSSVGSTNAIGEVKRAGYTGADVDGVEIFKAFGVAVNDAFLVASDSVLLGESAIQTFRFDEVEGPGVIKLALWSYFSATVLRASGVKAVTSAAA